jgi:rod shape-determining protein MreD
MNPYALVIALALVALLQVSLLPSLAIQGVSPDLMLVISVSWTLRRGVRSALVWAIVGGLWLDLLSGGPFGLYTLGLIVAVYLTGLGGGTIFQGRLILPIVMVALATIAVALVHLLLLWLTGQGVGISSDLGRLILTQMVYNMAVTLLIFPILSWLDRLTGQERLPLE